MNSFVVGMFLAQAAARITASTDPFCETCIAVHPLDGRACKIPMPRTFTDPLTGHGWCDYCGSLQGKIHSIGCPAGDELIAQADAEEETNPALRRWCNSCGCEHDTPEQIAANQIDYERYPSL